MLAFREGLGFVVLDLVCGDCWLFCAGFDTIGASCDEPP